MDYFLLNVDPNYKAPTISNPNNILNSKSITGKKGDLLPERMRFLVTEEKGVIFTDIIICSPYLLVRNNAMKVIKMYEPFYRFHPVFLCNDNMSEQYHIPLLEEIECLTDKSCFNLDKSIIEYAVIDMELIKEKALLRIGGVNSKKYILIRLDLVESLLRRGMVGIGLTPVDCAGNNNLRLFKSCKA